jgi:hypothetical protein
MARADVSNAIGAGDGTRTLTGADANRRWYECTAGHGEYSRDWSASRECLVWIESAGDMCNNTGEFIGYACGCADNFAPAGARGDVCNNCFGIIDPWRLS